jgi:hypothetical protein
MELSEDVRCCRPFSSFPSLGFQNIADQPKLEIFQSDFKVISERNTTLANLITLSLITS